MNSDYIVLEVSYDETPADSGVIEWIRRDEIVRVRYFPTHDVTLNRITHTCWIYCRGLDEPVWTLEGEAALNFLDKWDSKYAEIIREETPFEDED